MEQERKQAILTADSLWEDVMRLAGEVREAGAALGLPHVAAQSDLGDPEPMRDREGTPFAADFFTWIDSKAAYWRNRKLALESPFLHAARLLSEPICYHGDRLETWRRTRLLEDVVVDDIVKNDGIGAAFIAPVHMPLGQVGAVVWASEERIDMKGLFEAHADRLLALAIRFLATHAEASRRRVQPARLDALTRREVQCLRWAAAGKTNAEIGIILSLSVSTVRFHLRNAAEKLGATSRAQAIHIATGHGFVGNR